MTPTLEENEMEVLDTWYSRVRPECKAEAVVCQGRGTYCVRKHKSVSFGALSSVWCAHEVVLKGFACRVEKRGSAAATIQENL